MKKYPYAIPSPRRGEGRISKRGTSFRNSGEGYNPHAHNDNNVRSTVKILLTSSPTNLLTSKKASKVSVILNLFQDLDETLKHRGQSDVQCDVRRKLGKLCAFTLAEVLITLGIIGVVAAVTMPTVIQKHKEQTTIAKLKKVYSTLSNAYLLAMNENPDVTSWFPGNNTAENAEIFFEKLEPYLKIGKICGFGKGCLTEGYMKTLDGRDYADYENITNEYKFVLADGMHIWFWLSVANCSTRFCGNIKIDIDGKRGPFTYGKDVFQLFIYKDRLVPYGLPSGSSPFEAGCNRTSTKENNGAACAAWVLYNENMDYLHCDDLSWDGKTKCK